MIETLRLRNFRQHGDTTLHFVPGVNTIVGRNNSGKSTLPEAIEFAMYGSRALRDNAKGYIADGQSDGSAVVKLGIGEDIFTIGRNSKNAQVSRNGKVEASYKENVSAYIAQLSGVNQTGFRLGHYIRQKELAAFSSLRPGKRYETIERMLKVNAVDKAIKQVKERISDTEKELQILLATYTDTADIQKELDDTQILLGSVEFKRTSLQGDLNSIKEVLAQQQDRVRLQEALPHYEDVKAKLNVLISERARLPELEKELSDLGEISLERLKELQNKVTELQHDKTQSILMQNKKEELDSIVIFKLEEVEEPKPVDASSKTVAEANLNLATKNKDAFKSLLGKAHCPTCHQHIDEDIFITILSELTNKEIDCSAKFEEDSVEYAARLAEYKQLKTAYSDYLVDKQQLQLNISRKEKLLSEYIELSFSEEDLITCSEEIELLRDSREEAASLNAKISRVLRITSKAEEDSLNKELDGLKHLDTVVFDSELSDLIETNLKVEAKLNKDLNSACAEYATLESEFKAREDKLSEMKGIKVSINDTYDTIKKYKTMNEGFVLFKRHLTAKIQPLLQQVSETLFHKTTKNRYAAFNLSKDYEISLTTHSGYNRKLTTISGSENDLACLCLRLAIATLRSTKLAGSLGFIILDEISGSFDEERTKQTLEGLLELRDVIPQIINITHKEVEMRYADKLFTVKETNGNATVDSLPSI